MVAVAATLAWASVWRAPALAGDLVRDCLALSQSRGLQRVVIANRIGREQFLTKDRRLAEQQAVEQQEDASVALYRWSDIQRLCRP